MQLSVPRSKAKSAKREKRRKELEAEKKSILRKTLINYKRLNKINSELNKL